MRRGRFGLPIVICYVGIGRHDGYAVAHERGAEELDRPVYRVSLLRARAGEVKVPLGPSRWHRTRA